MTYTVLGKMLNRTHSLTTNQTKRKYVIEYLTLRLTDKYYNNVKQKKN